MMMICWKQVCYTDCHGLSSVFHILIAFSTFDRYERTIVLCYAVAPHSAVHRLYCCELEFILLFLYSNSIVVVRF